MHLVAWGLIGLALATGLVAGVFLTFSDVVMRSLAAAQPAAGTEAVQIINRKIYRSIFMVLPIGLIPPSIGVAASAAVFMTGPVSTVLAAGGLLYLVGVIAVSAFGNIPMNRKLDALPQGGSTAQAYWPGYVAVWVVWNHVRWIAATATTVCYMIGAVLLASAA